MPSRRCGARDRPSRPPLPPASHLLRPPQTHLHIPQQAIPFQLKAYTPTSQQLTAMPDPAALIAHIVSQTRQNIEFLISQNELSRDLGRDILSKLPSSSSSSNNDHSVMALSDATRRMTIPEPSSSPAHTHNMPMPGMPGGMMNSAVSTPQGPPPGRVNSPARSSYSSPPPHAHHGHAPPPDFGPPVRRGVPPPGPKVVRAKALWSYNENGQVCWSFLFLSWSVDAFVFVCDGCVFIVTAYRLCGGT